MIYKIKNQLLEVINEIEEYNELVFGRFSQFECVEKNDSNNYIRITEAYTEINISNEKKSLQGKIIKTDIYPIINNVIAYLIDDNKNILIHGITVSKNNKSILIVGDFGQGKTTLSEEFERDGYTINSTDQTWIQIEKNTIFHKLGSSFDIKQGKIKYLDKSMLNKKTEIEKIIRIVGLCNNGECICEYCKNPFYIIKNLDYFCNWNYYMPIFTDDIYLFDTRKKVNMFLKRIVKTNVKLIDARGDKNSIVKKVREM